MQRINFTNTTLNTLKRTANCSFANAVYKLTMKAQQGLKCDDLYKKSVLMDAVNKVLCKYKLDNCISFHPYLEGEVSTWYFGIGSFTGTITYYLTIDGEDVYIGEGTSVADIVTSINNNTEGTGVTAELSDTNYLTITSPVGCFVKADLYGVKSPSGTIPATVITFKKGKCPQEETCEDYTEEQLNCITPQDLQVLYEFTHKYKETLAKSTKKITNQTTNNSNSTSSDCCNWGSIGGSIGNQSDLVAYLQTIEKNFISAYDESTLLSSDIKSLKFLGAGVTATNSSGDISITIPGGGSGGSVAWGAITGTLTAQTDLTSYLASNYYPLSGNPSGFLTNISATNGLTESPTNTVKLGGTLIENTLITTDEFTLTLTGTATTNTFVQSILNTGIGDGLLVSTTSGKFSIAATNASSTLAGYFQSIGGNPLKTINKVNGASSVKLSEFARFLASGTASDNTGGYIEISSARSNALISEPILWLEGTWRNTATRDGYAKLYVTNAGTPEVKLTLDNVGKLQLNNYGINTFTGTPAYLLGVDSSGNVVETAVSGGGATDLAYTPSPTNGIVTSSTGTDATLTLADGTNAGLLSPADFTKLGNQSGTNTGNETTSTLGNTINGAASATPNDTDLVATVESSVVKKITWTSIKAFLKTYFDTLYQTLLISGTSIKTVNSTSLLGSGNIKIITPITTVTAGTAVTGTTSNTYCHGLLIPANTYAAGDCPTITFRFTKTGTAGTIIARLYANTTNNISGSPILIGTSSTLGATTLNSSMQRIVAIEVANGTGNGTTATAATFQGPTDFIVGTSAQSTLAINWTTDQYIVVAIQNANSGDSSNVRMIMVH